VEQALTGPEPVPAAASAPGAAGPVEVGQVFAAPDRTRRATGLEGSSVAFVLGGAVALAGVVLGYALGRRGKGA
jgi:hypothetical protein